MKCIIGLLTLLLFGACSADSVGRSRVEAKTDSVTFVTPEVSLNPIVSDIHANIGNQSVNSAHTISVPYPVTFSTQHQSPHHHTAAPQYDLNRMSTEQLAWYFASQNYTQADILSHPMLYMNSAYLVLVKQLPRYPEFVKKYYEDYRKYKGLRSLLGKMTFCYRHGMRKRFAFLYQECEKERVAQEVHAQKESERAAAQKKEEQVKKEAAEREAYIHELKRVENIVSDSPCKRLTVYNHQKRIDTIRYAQQHAERTKRHLKTGAEVFDFVAQYGITERHITEPLMNAYEYQLHTEFISHIHSTLALQRKHAMGDNNVFIDALGDGIALGMKSNYLHNPEWATRWSDFCYEATEIIKGIGEGILLGSYNTVDMVMHPVRTLVRIADGVRMLGSLTVKTIGTLAHWNYLIERGEYLQCATEMYAIGEQLIDMAGVIHEHTSQMSNREIAKHVTAFGTEWVLTGHMFAMGHALCSKLGGTIRNVISFLKDEGAAGEFALATTDGVLLKASENVSKGGDGIKNLVRNSNTILEAAHKQYMITLETELESLRALCDNRILDTARFGNKYLKPQYKHILGIELIFERNGSLSKVSGFHHDLLNGLEKTGVIDFTNKVVHENGFYKATLSYHGNVVKKTATFFPADWSRREVIEAIYDAYNNFLKSGLQSEFQKGKYIVRGLTNQGVTIEMFITQSGHVATAYPLL